MALIRNETRALLISVIGADAALKLMHTRWVAGCSVEIPKSRSGRGEKTCELLTEIIGKEAADKLIAYFGGEKIYIPRDRDGKRALRNRQIVEAYGKGISIRELANEYEISDRHIWEILKTTDMSAAH